MATGTPSPFPGVAVYTRGVSTSVTVTTPAGVIPQLYADQYGVSTLSNPTTVVTSPTTLYLSARGTYVVNGQTVNLNDVTTPVVSVTVGAPLSPVIESPLQSPTAGATQTLDASQYPAWLVQAPDSASTLTLNLANGAVGQALTLALYERATASATTTLAWSATGGTVTWTGTTPTAFTAGSNTLHLFTLITLDGSNWTGASVPALVGTDIAGPTMKPNFPLMLMTSPPTGSASPGTNSAVFSLFIVQTKITVTKNILVVGASAGNIDTGIFDSTGTNGLPGNKLASSGSVACPGNSGTSGDGKAVAFTSAVTLAPGSYWSALATSSSSATFNYGVVGAGLAALIAADSVRANQTVFPLPATAASSGVAVSGDASYYFIVPASI